MPLGPNGAALRPRGIAWFGGGWMIALLMVTGCSRADGDGPPAPAPKCVRPEGLLSADASLEGQAGEYRLTMVEEVDGTATRTAEGSLLLLNQVETLRQFTGSTGGSIPGVTSPLFGSTDRERGRCRGGAGRQPFERRPKVSGGPGYRERNGRESEHPTSLRIGRKPPDPGALRRRLHRPDGRPNHGGIFQRDLVERSPGSGIRGLLLCDAEPLMVRRL